MKVNTNIRRRLRAWRDQRRSGTGGGTIPRSLLTVGMVVGATAVSLVASTPEVSAVARINCLGPDLVMTTGNEVVRIDKNDKTATEGTPLIGSSKYPDTKAPIVIPGVDYFNEVGVIDGGTRIIFTAKRGTTLPGETPANNKGEPVLVDVNLVDNVYRIVTIPEAAWTPRDYSVGVSGSYDPNTGLFYFGDYENWQVEGELGSITLSAYNPKTADPATAITPDVLTVFAPAQNPGTTPPQDGDPEKGFPGGNGDFTFDADGNLFLVNSSADNFAVYNVGGPISNYEPEPGQVIPTVVAKTINGGSTATGEDPKGVINGIAFGSDGFLYTSGNRIRTFNLGVPAYVGSIPISGTDLASCVDPSRVSVYKALPSGRVKAGDQFQIEVQGPPGNTFEFGYQAVTRGDEPGLQEEQDPATGFREFVGPLIGNPGITYTIKETVAGTTNLADYSTTWECINTAADNAVVATGTGTEGQFLLPTQNGGGSSIVCTFTNLPVAAGSLTVQKDLPNGRVNAGDQFTLALDGASSVTTSGSATGIQPQKAVLARAMGGMEYKFSEAAAGTTVLDYYDTTYECLDSDGASVVAGSGTSGAVTMPTGGKDVTCTFKNVAKPTGLKVQKDSDPVKGTTLVAGQSVVYTLTFENTGGVPYQVDYVDDLSGVLDDATVTVAPALATGAGLNVSSIAVGQFSISGELAPASKATVTYTAQVKPDGQRKDDLLVNYLLKKGETKDKCEDDDPLCTKHPVVEPELVPAKDSDPVKGTKLRQGDTVVYTLSFTNKGKAPAPVDFVDDLNGVLDDAEVTVDPALATGEGLTVSAIADGKFTIKGEVAGESAATVTYTAKVKPDGDRGDNLLVNYLLEPGEVKTKCEDTDNLCTKHPVIEPDLAVKKSSDPVSGTELLAGDEVVYTLSFDNNGTAPSPVNYLDNLEDVLDDATVIVDPALATGSGLTVSGVADGEFSITGELAAKSSATVTYTAKVKPDDERNNDLLVNYLLLPGGNKTNCEVGDPLCTKHPVIEPKLDILKTSDPVSGTTLLADQEVVYTLKFTNSGTAAAGVDYVDRLGDVLDDATVTVAPALATGEGLTVSSIAAGEFTIKGQLAPDSTATVTYTAKVKPDGQRGNDLLVNFLLKPGDTKTVCEDGDTDCTKHPVAQPELVIAKSSDPVKGTALKADQLVTYTLSFDNAKGTSASKVDFVDNLVDVLDDATVTVQPALATGTGLTVSAIADGKFTITGELAAGASATVTYTAKVKADGARGNNLLVNYLLEPGEVKTVCEDTDTTCTKHPVPETPAIDLVKTAASIQDVDTNNLTTVGDIVTYEFKVTNTGQNVLNDIELLDPKLSDAALQCPKTTLAVGESMMCSAVTYTILPLDLGAGAVYNTATVSGIDPVGTKVTATDSEVVPVTVPPSISPPTNPTTSTTIVTPPTGSSSAGPLAAMATLAVMLGSAMILLSRVRRRQAA